MMKPTIYLDHAATTPLDARVLESMLPYMTESYGNASSVHRLGRQARGAVEDSREKVAAMLGAEPSEIVFTSGGTEANNLAIVGTMMQGGAIVTSEVEHEAVLEPVSWLSSRGCEVRYVPVCADATVDPDVLSVELNSVERQRCLVSLMHINNEVGSVNDIGRLADAAHTHNAYLHSDAVQSVGLLDVDVQSLGVDLLSMSAHKLYGPKGVGALYVRSGIEMERQNRGGSQERSRRAGTENVAGIVGFSRALEIAVAERSQRRERLSKLRDLLTELLLNVSGSRFVLNSGAVDDRLAPHIVNVSVRRDDGLPFDGEMLLLNMDMEGVSVSSGSACSSGTVRPSHVLEALGRSRGDAGAAVRFSLGKDTSRADVESAVDRLRRVVERMHDMPGATSEKRDARV
ncbi:MAG: cysteine desulfurase [Rhodothermales bacterium]|nr:cysteine desulfurase [Rhodothermales bacterium]